MSTDVTAEWAATNLAWCEEHRQWLFYCPIQIGDRDVFHKCMEAHDQKLREQIAQEIMTIMPADSEDVSENFTFNGWNEAVRQCAGIVRSTNEQL